VGGSHVLPDLGGHFGLYLGLTGNRIRYGDALWSGLATHTVSSEYLDGLLEHLSDTGDAGSALREVFRAAPRETPTDAIHAIARHFSKPSLGEILASLEKEAADQPFAAETLATMAKRSPTSLAVTFRQIRSGHTLSMEECMRMEFRILNRMLTGHDFYEGIRAALIDRGSTPSWDPVSLDAIRPRDIDAYFAPLGAGELAL
jgi:enoyl-CoA hydratase/carnithine racemase